MYNELTRSDGYDGQNVWVIVHKDFLENNKILACHLGDTVCTDE